MSAVTNECNVKLSDTGEKKKISHFEGTHPLVYCVGGIGVRVVCSGTVCILYITYGKAADNIPIIVVSSEIDGYEVNK